MNLNKIKNFYLLARLDKPVGIFLLLWPTLWAYLWATNGRINLADLIIFILGVILTRSAGCVINDIFDYKFDKQVQRTSSRPLAQDKISRFEAICFFFILILFSLSLLFFLNSYVFKIVFISGIFLMLYPLAKRFIPIPQIFLALTFSTSVMMVFAHVQQNIPNLAWLLFFLNFFWVIAYDSIYALADLKDDQKLNIYSAPKFFKSHIYTVILICYVFFVGLIFNLPFNKFYSMPITIIFSLVFIFNLVRKIKEQVKLQNSSNNYIYLFKQNNYLGFFITAFFGIDILFNNVTAI